MLPIVTAGQMKEIDRRATGEWGIPGAVLMENAGRAVVDCIARAVDDLAGARVTVVCGRGNNGGDGFVITRHMLNRGIDARCLLLGSVPDLKGDALLNAGILRQAGIAIEEVSDPPGLAAALAGSQVIVDALIGTGLDRAPHGLAAAAIEAINHSGAFVVSVDVPSGLDADTGATFQPCVRASLTVTMALPKFGLLLYPGRAFAGRVEVADIGIPARLLPVGRDAFILDDRHVASVLPARAPDGHKGTFGTALLVCGARGFSGAACLAASAALRSGAGLVKVAVPRGISGIVETAVPEAVKVPLAQTARETIAPEALDEVIAAAEGASSVALGPGLTTDPDTTRLVLDLLPRLACPLVLDADALNMLPGNLDVLKKLKAMTILTPHPGEFARLTGTDPARVNRDRVGLPREFARAHGVIVVLKGAPTVVALPSGEVFINPTGNSGLASGGTGDVLTGLMAGLLAQHAEPHDAAAAAVFLHGRAADIALEHGTARSLTAGDVVAALPRAFSSIGPRPVA